MPQSIHTTSPLTSTTARVTELSRAEPPAPSRPGLPRRSSSLHKALITKLRPLPFQYVWSVWHSKASSAIDSSQPHPTQHQALDAYRLSLLVESVADIGTFYRIFNNLPWSTIRQKESIHIFRAGVRPLWEDQENIRGGRWLIRVRSEIDEDAAAVEDVEKRDGRRRDVRTWEEVCLLCLGGELQSVIAQERDHILGVSFSSRSIFTHISIWTKQGDNQRSILLLERAILSGLSPDLRPKSTLDFNYRRHTDKVGFANSVGMPMMASRQQSQVQMVAPFLPHLSAVGAATMIRPSPIRLLTVG